jgi:biotin operon repressor
MIYPDFLPVLPPNPDLNQDIQQDYKEAASILKKSPRGACALLRLALQKLMVQLGKSGKNLNDDIAKLVKEGLPQKIQRALDIVRVIGNNAVHPGQIDIRDDENTGYKLFELINLIAESMITRAKEIDKLYNSLPEDQRKAIEERDKKLK